MKISILIMSVLISLLMINGTASAKELSPEWVKQLPSAKEATQLLIVAGVGKTTAWVSMHERDKNGNWQQIMTTPGFIGKNGLGKTKEGDGMTPIGVFHFNKAFGIKKNPGTVFEYTKVNENHYWSGDQNPGMGYNTFVDVRDYPNLDTENSEHLIDYALYYNYALNISWNEECVPGKGSGIFLHCFGPFRPYTGGCVAIPEDKMLFVMKHVKKDCVVIIDYLKNISAETYKDWNL
ncbi:MAG: L,D-transpeptidase family protein [Selenomonadaceae bacterium]|nr:L,D-transpeptidase family protein [Selenomonadaceae bacterium]MBR1859623.1 L,D-transpeptidase family protein [Selenomonadaceae bacterium]